MSQSTSLRQHQSSVQSINLDRNDLWKQALKEPQDTLKTLSEIICDMERAKDRAIQSHLIDEIWTAYHQHEEIFHAKMAACLYRLAQFLTTPANKPTRAHWDLFENLFMNQAGRSSFAHSLNLSESAKLIVSAGAKWLEHQADFESPPKSGIEALGHCINRVEALVCSDLLVERVLMMLLIVNRRPSFNTLSRAASTKRNDSSGRLE